MLISIIFILIAITVHEFAHAYMADRLGDPTAKLEGRLTLNPFAHLDPVGTLALILFKFGWGKPVPVDYYNLRHPRKDGALIAFAGPASSLVLALVFALINRFVFPIPVAIIIPFLSINLSLAFFNLLPIPPLDGSKVILGLVPFEKAEGIEEFFSTYGFALLLFLFLPVVNGQSLLNLFLTPAVVFSLRILLFNF